MTVKDLKDKNLILFEVISGSRAYGTHKPTSDTDIRGVFILPLEDLLGLNYVGQVADGTNDTVYYELGRFLQLLQSQNPNIIELFNMPEENIIYKDQFFDAILQYREKFLSKVCRDSFGGYAVAQIKKARGLNKKIVNPIPKEKKSILEFCHMISGSMTKPLNEYLIQNHMDQGDCGLVNIPHARDTYALYYGRNCGYRGIVNEDETSNEVRLSSVSKNSIDSGVIYFNKDGYTKYCKDYKSYWGDWMENRNEDRYNTNQEHGKGYDSKNMMHCIRLLRMATEIAEQKKVIVKRPDAEELLKIRNGEMEYDALLAEAEETLLKLDELYDNCDLPAKIDPEFVSQLLADYRIFHYNILNSVKMDDKRYNAFVSHFLK